ncbi:MAG: T9SS type A sorting domain-containing protein [Saprospiraceae bacterium]|nr:T9SS type A sorting domain-containing protein [Saprospiraceae bacterium]
MASKQVRPLEFEVSPNPVVNKIRVICQEAIVENQILDLYGKTLLKSQQKSLDLESLQAGVYVLSVRTRDQIGYKRFVKRSN